MLRNSLDTLLGLIGFACNKNVKKNKGTCKYIMGVGEVSPNDVDLERILGNANVANAASVAAKQQGSLLMVFRISLVLLICLIPTSKFQDSRVLLGVVMEEVSTTLWRTKDQYIWWKRKRWFCCSITW